MNTIAGFKALIVGVLATVTTTVAPIIPTHRQNVPMKTVTASPVVSISAKPNLVPAQTQIPVTVPASSNSTTTSNPLPLDGKHYYYILGTYSYLGQKINYHMIVPKNGGSFSGAISGACEAQIGADYAGGNGGSIKGSASGRCNILFVKYEGTIHFKGNLYPEEKKLVVELQGAHLPAITLNYN